MCALFSVEPALGKRFLAGCVVEGENECMEYKETILIVDDSALNRMVLTEILGKENYTFLEAENGQQAVELLDCTRRSTCCCWTSPCRR